MVRSGLPGNSPQVIGEECRRMIRSGLIAHR
jgi:hypothetical protein